MVNITGSGAPTKETVGCAGAIYEDTTTGTRYICTFSCEIGDTIDCEWEEVKETSKTEELNMKAFPEKMENKNIPNRRKDYTAYNKNRK